MPCMAAACRCAGSSIVAAQTVWSSGVGASVGLEAGYTQLASGIASKYRSGLSPAPAVDMRILVGRGAAAAIAGAFGAPLGGAFYGFELIIGSDPIASLAPVGMAALLGYLTAQIFAPDGLGIETGAVSSLAVHDVVIAGGVGLLAAIFGIALMRGVAACEVLFSRLRVKPAFRPMLGGAVVGLLAMVSPQVMSSGHGALASDRHFQTAAGDHRADLRAQGARLDRFARHGVPRRLVFRFAAARRARWPTVRGRAQHGGRRACMPTRTPMPSSAWARCRSR